MQIVSIGGAAGEILSQSLPARLIGVTSRGLFILTPADWVLFLSIEPYRGPLTLNLDEGWGSTPFAAAGDPVEIRADGLWFPKSQTWIASEGAKVWIPPERPAGLSLPVETLVRTEIRTRLTWVGEQAWTQPPPQPVPEQSWQAHPVEKAKPDRWPGEFSAAELDDIAQALSTRQVRPIVARVTGLLGRGSGLTPAGDDLALGLLLAINRWYAGWFEMLPVLEISQQISESARKQTTTLSANLIACAARGLADERLILGLDGLVSGTPGAVACAAFFKQWGNTSGVSALAGMTLALNSVLVEP